MSDSHAPQTAHGAHELSFLRKYIFSEDHKIIGIQFLFSSLIFLVIGGALALLWAVLEVRRTANGDETANAPVGLLEGAAYALVFLGAVSWVVYTLAGWHFSGWSPLRMTVLTAIPGAIGLVAINAIAIGLGYVELPTFAAVWSVKWQLAYFVVFTVVLGVLGFNNGVKYLGALNTMLMLNLVPVIVFAIEAWLGRSYAAIELAGAAAVIGALVANNLFLRWQAAPR